MKFALLFSAAACASVAPPQIDLNLEGMTASYKLKSSIYRKHDLGFTQPTGKAVMSRQDYTERCQAGKANGVSCPSPVAKAYDHKDKAVKVVTRI